MSDETRLRDLIVRVGASLFDRGLTAGSSGNISVRLPDGGWLMTPTNACLGTLDAARLSLFDAAGRHVSGDAPTKESFLHFALYAERTGAGAVVHLHSTHATAVSILRDVDPADVMPALTAYYIMRVGRLPLIPYFAPGDPDLGHAVRAMAGKHHALLLANHGPIVAGSSLTDAQYAAEELEETARLFLLLQNHALRTLTPEQVADLRARFNLTQD